MGAVFKKPIAGNDWNSIYAEALRLEASFIKTNDISTKRRIFNQWLTIRSWGHIMAGSADRRDLIDTIHTNIIRHNIGLLYTIDESTLHAPLIG